jgi:hypothetical protein
MTSIARREADAVRWPHRRTLLVVEVLVAAAAVEGGLQLMFDAATPPDADLPGPLDSWVLPGLWLLASVAVPSAIAAVLLRNRSPHAPLAVLLAAAALAVELLVQIPFLGPSVLQAVLGAVVILVTVLALDARRRGWGVR